MVVGDGEEDGFGVTEVYLLDSDTLIQSSFLPFLTQTTLVLPIFETIPDFRHMLPILAPCAPLEGSDKTEAKSMDVEARASSRFIVGV